MSVPNGSYTRSMGFGPARAEDGSYPVFYIEDIEDPKGSAEAGRMIFRQEERVKIHMAGNPFSVAAERVSDMHREKWPKQYAAFKSGHEMSHDGTPLEEWPILRSAMVKELKALGIYTIEQTASLPDTAVQRIGMGGYQLREKAKAYLDEAAELALVERVTYENTQLASQVAEQSGQITELKKLCDEMYSQLSTLRNGHNPIATAMPGMADFTESRKPIQSTEAPSASSIASFAAPEAPKRRGRRSNAEKAALAAAQTAAA